MKLHDFKTCKRRNTQRQNVLVVVKLPVHGGTSTKGNKGAQAVPVIKSKMAHEGGQMPIQRRIPKRGFKNPHRIEYKVFNLGQVEQLAEKYNITEFSLENLYINGLIAQTDA